MDQTLFVVNDHLVRALQHSQPELSSTELASVVNVITAEIGLRLSEGYNLAFMKAKADGDVELRVLNIDIVKKVGL